MNKTTTNVSLWAFIVWYDTALSEIVIVEKKYYNPILEAQLLKEAIEPVLLYASSRQDAREGYLKRYEYLIKAAPTLVFNNQGAQLLQ